MGDPRDMTTLDELDQGIIERMRVDPLISAKALAAQLKVTEQTISARIRSLQEAHHLRVVVQSDVHAMGYEFVCFADIYVAGRGATAVAAELADISGVSAVALSLGHPEIIVMFNAMDRKDFLRIVNQDFAAVRGVDRVETVISMDIDKYRTEYARLRHA